MDNPAGSRRAAKARRCISRKEDGIESGRRARTVGRRETSLLSALGGGLCFESSACGLSVNVQGLSAVKKPSEYAMRDLHLSQVNQDRHDRLPSAMTSGDCRLGRAEGDAALALHPISSHARHLSSSIDCVVMRGQSGVSRETTREQTQSIAEPNSRETSTDMVYSLTSA